MLHRHFKYENSTHVTNVNRAKVSILEYDIPKTKVWKQYLNKPSDLKSYIFIKYGTLSPRNNNEILDLEGNKRLILIARGACAS